MLTQPPNVFQPQGRKTEAGKALGVVLVLAVLVIGIPMLLRYGTSPPSQAGIDVRNLVNGQETFLTRVGRGRYAATLSDLQKADMIESQLGSGTKSGYAFTLTTDDAGKTFTITGRPEEYGTRGARSFFANQTGVVRSTDEDRSADSDDAPF